MRLPKGTKLWVGPILFLALSLGRSSLCSASPAGAAASPKNRLNLLLITIDTMRADKIAFTNPGGMKTPALDSLAAKSLVFSRAFAHTTTTLPSHTNILLGVTPSFHGVHDNVNFVVRDEFLTLAEHLKASGYSTGAFLGGYSLDSRFGLDQGFDVYDDDFGGGDLRLGQGANAGERKAQAVLDSARRWLRGRSSPWFAWVHFFDPHDPYEPPEPFRSQYASRLYDGEVAYVDSVMASLLRTLEENGVLSKTMIVLTGDHGESFGEHGERMHGYLAYNPTLWIPMMVFYPGAPPQVVRQNVSHIDIFPTVCDGLGIKKPSSLQGNSLFPLLQGKKVAEPVIYFESLLPYYSFGWAPLRGTIEGRAKFIDSPLPEFYDLSKDFEEKDNLISRQNLNACRNALERMIRAQTTEASLKAGQTSDRETRERLRSLGYAANLPSARKKTFTAEDTVTTLLPYHTRAEDALLLFHAGKAEEAVGRLNQILAARKNIMAAYLNLAFIHRSQGRLKEAIAVLRKGRESMPENYSIYFRLIATLYEAGDFQDVLRTFEAGTFAEIGLDPIVWNYIGLAYEQLGEGQRALASYEESLAIDGKFAVTYHNLGSYHFRLFRQTGRPEDYALALKNYQKAVELDPGYGEAFLGLGVAAYQAGKFPQAISSLEKALSLDSRLEEAFYFLGSAYLQAGNKSKALENFVTYKATSAYRGLSPSAKAKLEETIARAK